jgi:hypothetical protein
MKGVNKVCIFDNPVGFRREYWRDGKLVGWYTKEFLDQADKILTITKKMEVHLRRFEPGVLLGDSDAKPA